MYVAGVSLCPLGGEQSSGVTHGIGDPIELAAVVAIGDPQDLAIGQAGGGREAHRSFAVCSGILQGVWGTRQGAP